MSLNIKNERVHELAREAARRTGLSQTGAVEQALKSMLQDLESRADDDLLVCDLIAISDAFAARTKELGEPPLNTDDLYDERGLPA